MKHTFSASPVFAALLFGALFIVHVNGFSTNSQHAMKKTEITKVPFGTAGGADVYLFTISNSSGMTATITNYGGIVTSLRVPDKKGVADNIVLGFDSLDTYTNPSYIKGCPYLGALIGRYGNRIAGGEFSLDGNKYSLAKNNGRNHLHGGTVGFDKVVWTPSIIATKDGSALQLKYVSKDGEEGYPGTLSVTVAYALTAANELAISYKATTDKKTVVNLTHHSYFNLAGEGAGDVLRHSLRIMADAYTPVTDDLIPTGERKDVTGTPFDFRTPTLIGKRITDVPGGYDHNFVLKGAPGHMRKVARVEEHTTGRIMEVSTTEPGMQFYSGNFLNGAFAGHSGRPFAKHYGFCLETQHFPDSPNQKNFPTTVLLPKQTYSTTTVYTFTVSK